MADMDLYTGKTTEGFTQEQIDMLNAPLDASVIKQRPDGKKYLKGSTEFEAANRIFGHGKWTYRVINRTLQKVHDLDDKLTGMYFYVEVELYVAGAMFPFYGDGGQGVKYFTPQGYEDAAKGATTDAAKRALRHYGEQFGLPLYNEDSLVDMGDGSLARVGDVKVSPTGNTATRRVIESGAAQRQIPAPSPDKTKQLRELITDCLNRAKSSGIVKTRDDWNKLKADAGVGKPDSDLVVADVDRVSALLTEREKQPANA
jgi:hypothetical protein